jgi:hypothetical protein
VGKIDIYERIPVATPAKPVQKQMIGDLRPGEPVDAVFMVVECSVRPAKTGNPYLAGVLRDRTGQIPIRMWDVTENEKFMRSFMLGFRIFLGVMGVLTLVVAGLVCPTS